MTVTPPRTFQARRSVRGSQGAVKRMSHCVCCSIDSWHVNTSMQRRSACVPLHLWLLVGKTRCCSSSQSMMGAGWLPVNPAIRSLIHWSHRIATQSHSHVDVLTPSGEQDKGTVRVSHVPPTHPYISQQQRAISLPHHPPATNHDTAHLTQAVPDTRSTTPLPRCRRASDRDHFDINLAPRQPTTDE